ncbi:MAG TPA: AAA family ATPase [Gaiella sp.]|nr:AAA family ATPase [Gaiella sp.]
MIAEPAPYVRERTRTTPRPNTSPLGDCAWALVGFGVAAVAEIVATHESRQCAQLSATATTIAPAFITDEYDIMVRPLLPSERVAFSGSKTQTALKAKRDGELFDLAVAGSGLRTWARSIREAMRILRPPPSNKEPERTTIYVLDEPERHLHPAAQEEVARWIAERVEAGAGAIIATHALPFLDLPYAGSEYYRVFRDEQGLSRAGRLTTDPIGILDRFVGQA